MRLIALGRPHVVQASGEEVELQPLPLALLAYLAIGGPRDRTHLADLFWHGTKSGLNSLSTTLTRIREAVPDGVWVRGNTLVGTDVACDVGNLHDAIDRSDYESVLQLYGAPFLEGLKLRRRSVEFEDWILETRTTLASTVELVVLQHARELHDASQHRTAATAAEAAWEIAIRDGFPSPDYFETYHRILVSATSPTASAVRSMAEEFGIELPLVEPVVAELSPTSSNQVSETASTTESGEAPVQPVAPAASSPGDQPGMAGSTPLFGCEEELDAIASSVSEQKLTTVVGLGGSGKTRLAAEFFNSERAQRDFSHRYWVDLRDVGDDDLVAPAIAASVGQAFDNVASLADRLATDESALLVLDNFDLVLQAAEIAQELVQGNETVRILVTSRVPLEVTAESLVQLSGLDISDSELDSPAEQLFVSSARRGGVSNDRLSTWDREAIQDVCRKVGGNPLAIEMAGGWAQVLPPTEILDALTQSNELLGSPMASDLRTMQAVLNQSWATLAETEQNTLMLLATFPGGCLTKEALKLQELPIRSIGRLVQHSLARLHVEGRITLHPLIQSHALAELEKRPDLHRLFHQVLSDWCRSFADSQTTNSQGADAQGLSDEIANFAHAWAHDAQHSDWELHRSTLAPLRQFFTGSGRASEGRALFAMATDALKHDPSGPQDLLAASLEALGWFHLLTGEIPKSRARLDEALALADAALPHPQARIRRTIGILHSMTGDLDAATTSFTAALALFDDEPDPLTAELRYDLAQVHHFRGERDQASTAARLALEAGRSSDNRAVIVSSYILLARIELRSDPQRAIVLLNEGRVIADEAALDYLATYFPPLLGQAHLNLREAELAERHFTEGLAAASNVGQLANMCPNYTGRAEARLLREDVTEAIEDLTTSIRMALKTRSAPYLIAAAVVSCRAAATPDGPGERKEQIQQLLSLTLQHPAADQDARNQATTIWEELFGKPPTSVIEAEPAAAAEAPDLDEIAERSLQLLTVR